MHEINKTLERNINDQHKAMILGENAKRFYNL
jgi:predicted TIM-barrel fold metal-dependent hydrolase